MDTADMSDEGAVIRPPSEAESLIIQLTLGCSDNRCIFCPAYKQRPFRVRSFEEIERDLRRAAARCPGARRIFFADGDALAAGQAHLERVFEAAMACFPGLARIGAYGSVKSLEGKSPDELRRLRERRLGVVYLGFETGDDDVYKLIRKHGSPRGNVEACRKLGEAGIRTNVTVVLGLGGRERSFSHAEQTARVLNLARPDQVAALTLMIVPGTPLADMTARGAFEPLDAFGLLEELHRMLSSLEDFRCQFFANHASNYLPVRARFPKDRPAVLRALREVIRRRDGRQLIPDFLRGL